MFLHAKACLTLRFVRRGRAAHQGAFDYDIISDDELGSNEDVADWLDASGMGPEWDLLSKDQNKKICKYLDPGCVNDLFQHYLGCRQSLGAAAVSSFIST